MPPKPLCVIVTGRPGSGKTTLAKRLGEALCLPVISRDGIKEGFVEAQGVAHAQLPPDTNARVSELFFALVGHYLAGGVSVVIEAAFQHHVWAARLPAITEIAEPFLIVCTVDDTLAVERQVARGLSDPRRTCHHGDDAVAHFQATGSLPTPSPYTPPELPIPTLPVSTDGAYQPSLEDILRAVTRGSGIVFA
jgi:predicted kinase